jgi:hypothetical protein
MKGSELACCEKALVGSAAARRMAAGLIGGRNVEAVHDRDAVLHDEFYISQDGDVGERVAVDGDEVGVFAGFDGTDTILPT